MRIVSSHVGALVCVRGAAWLDSLRYVQDTCMGLDFADIDVNVSVDTVVTGRFFYTFFEILPSNFQIRGSLKACHLFEGI